MKKNLCVAEILLTLFVVSCIGVYQLWKYTHQVLNINISMPAAFSSIISAGFCGLYYYPCGDE